MNALHDLADTSLDTSLVAQVGHVLSTLSDDDAGFLGGHYGSEGKLGLGVFLIRLRSGLAVRAKTVIHLELVHLVEHIGIVANHDILRRHLDVSI